MKNYIIFLASSKQPLVLVDLEKAPMDFYNKFQIRQGTEKKRQ